MRKLTYQEFEAKAKKVHGDKYLYYHDYINSRTKVKITCLECGVTFYQLPTSHSGGTGCANCVFLKNVKNQSLTYQEFEERSTKLYNGKYRYYQDYVNSYTKIKITCLDCGETLRQTPHNHSRGAGGCSNCSRCKQLTYQQFEERATIIHEGKYLYYHDYVNAYTKIKIMCLGCGKIFRQMPYAHSNDGHGCPNCFKLSKNENLCKKYLLELIPQFCNDPDFHTHKALKDVSKTQRINPDFRLYVNGKMIIIEYQGAQHYRPVRFGGMSLKKATKQFNEYQVPRDKALRKYCKKNAIILFEIDGRKYKGEKIRRYIIDKILPIINSI